MQRRHDGGQGTALPLPRRNTDGRADAKSNFVAERVAVDVADGEPERVAVEKPDDVAVRAAHAGAHGESFALAYRGAEQLAVVKAVHEPEQVSDAIADGRAVSVAHGFAEPGSDLGPDGVTHGAAVDLTFTVADSITICISLRLSNNHTRVVRWSARAELHAAVRALGWGVRRDRLLANV